MRRNGHNRIVNEPNVAVFQLGEQLVTARAALRLRAQEAGEVESSLRTDLHLHQLLGCEGE